MLGNHPFSSFFFFGLTRSPSVIKEMGITFLSYLKKKKKEDKRGISCYMIPTKGTKNSETGEKYRALFQLLLINDENTFFFFTIFVLFCFVEFYYLIFLVLAEGLPS